jgi:type I restriction-modification system DNA methylase subunit
MSSQASSAGRDEAVVRQKLVETGAVDVMIDIRGNFFYTRTVPCQLWFFDRSKEKDATRRDNVLMLDARRPGHDLRTGLPKPLGSSTSRAGAFKAAIRIVERLRTALRRARCREVATR